MAAVQITRDLKTAPRHESVEVSTEKLRAVLLGDSDKSDPLNQLVVAGLKVNERFAIRATVSRFDSKTPEGDAIVALAAALIEYHADIRDALAEKE